MRGMLGGGILVLGLLGSAAWADRGGEIPVPFGGVNQRVELADGEEYFLVGTIVNIQAQDGVFQPYLKVDLDQHPWLANAHRVAFPYYPIASSDATLQGSGSRSPALDWRSLDGQPVQMWVRAHGQIAEIALELLSAPWLGRPRCVKRPSGID
jgi:hypothetical protein